MAAVSTRVQSKLDILLSHASKATTNVQGSKVLMKALTTAAFSGIPYFRKMFPENSFDSYNIGDVQVPFIKSVSTSKNSNSFYQLLDSIRDGIDKEYIKEVTINIYKDRKDPQSIMESYSYKYKYNGNPENDIDIKEKKNSEYIVRSIKHLMKNTKTICDSLNALPTEWDMALILRYNDNVPEDYISIGFETCDTMPGKAKGGKTMLGNVQTPYHLMRAYAYTENVPNNMYEAGQVESQQSVQSVFGELSLLEEKEGQSIFGEPTLLDKKEDENPSGNVTASLIEDDSNTGQDINGTNEDIEHFTCPCERNYSPTFYTLIECSICCNFQHAECYGLLVGMDNSNFKHVCHRCALENDNVLCSDPTFPSKYQANQAGAKYLCYLRSTLASFNYYRKITMNDLANLQLVSRQTAKTLLDTAVSMKVLQRADPRANIKKRDLTKVEWIVDLNKLKKRLAKYFIDKTRKQDIEPFDQDVLQHIQDYEEFLPTPNVITNNMNSTPEKAGIDYETRSEFATPLNEKKANKRSSNVESTSRPPKKLCTISTQKICGSPEY